MFRWKTTVKSWEAKKFALYNKVTDSYHAECITCIHRTARFLMRYEEKISIHSMYRLQASRTCAIQTFQTDLQENRAIKAFVIISFTFFCCYHDKEIACYCIACILRLLIQFNSTFNYTFYINFLKEKQKYVPIFLDRVVLLLIICCIRSRII